MGYKVVLGSFNAVICLIVVGLVILVPSSSFSQNRIQQAIDQLSKDPTLKHASWGIAVMDVETEKLIASHNATLSLVPASSLKVVTTSTALAELGPDYTFTTEVQYDGTLDNSGNLDGNVYIKGYGDPTLGSDQLDATPGLDAVIQSFRLSIQQKGIRSVNGYIVGDASYFDSAVNGKTWQWNDLGNYYGAGSWGLNLHENLYYLHFRQTNQLGGTPGIALVEPAVPKLSFYNEVTSAERGSGDNAYIYGAPYTYDRFVRGTIPVGSGTFTIKGSIPDPPLFAAQNLEAQLRSVGIIAAQGPITQQALMARGHKDRPRQTLYKHQSPPLSIIVERTNIKSVNLYCETLLRALGKVKQDEGSVEAGLEVIEDYWKAKSVDFSGCYLEDGSGLSSKNVVTPQFMAQIMAKTAKDPAYFEAFYDSLPIAGRSGGMKYMARGTAADGKLRAKTGTLKRVRSFTGYAETRSGKRLAFSMIMNNYAGSGGAIRKKLEQVMIAMCL